MKPSPYRSILVRAVRHKNTALNPVALAVANANMRREVQATVTALNLAIDGTEDRKHIREAVELIATIMRCIERVKATDHDDYTSLRDGVNAAIAMSNDGYIWRADSGRVVCIAAAIAHEYVLQKIDARLFRAAWIEVSEKMQERLS